MRSIRSAACTSFRLSRQRRYTSVVAWNSLTRSLQQVVPPIDHKLGGKQSDIEDTSCIRKWYACGPTVYDRAHLGHARAYVSQDIIRRIIERQFGISFFLVMGVTDIDDKIIQRAKERQIHYLELARAEESQFFYDLDRLGVRRPHAVTRVSEHVEEIIRFIERIVLNGFAYIASDVSGVYFDTEQLGTEYGKLDPSQGSSVEAVELMYESKDSIKKNPKDFVLWKTVKEPQNEPCWESPWGLGRPGWHIECSAMIHYVLGDKIDLHTGGIDLRFPHHNNEIAQSEAHNYPQNKTCCSVHQINEPWCRHFLHFGHLYIQGQKMSKSLKNFTTIEAFLEKHTADQFRVFCLQYKYRSNIHYSSERMRDAAAFIDKLCNFFRNVEAYSSHESSEASKKCTDLDLEILKALFHAKERVSICLADDFDTPSALQHISKMVSRANEYLLTRQEHNPIEIRMAIAQYVLDVLELFGMRQLYEEFAHLGDQKVIRKISDSERRSESSGIRLDGLMQAVVDFRAQVRQRALEEGSSSILELCDAFRNDALPSLGIQLKDLGSGRTTCTFEQPSHAAEDAEAEKRLARERLKAKEKEYQQMMNIPPQVLFQIGPMYAGKYSAFDAQGLPTKDAVTNEPLSKSQRKKLQKKQLKHQIAYKKYQNLNK
uniref:cysteine--tRNA ligase n=1 Tax=Albugo laibachii Nc14 TaxID=890382 RepID=F0WFT7_9STRA|nr:cysteinyltRNA synthetase putative [Albugo laibachii Nc14]|eukprot:CCA20071.1 cysteinyltRNA synthetase putative [Albugo laibachii Nc14]